MTLDEIAERVAVAVRAEIEPLSETLRLIREENESLRRELDEAWELLGIEPRTVAERRQ